MAGFGFPVVEDLYWVVPHRTAVHEHASVLAHGREEQGDGHGHPHGGRHGEVGRRSRRVHHRLVGGEIGDNNPQIDRPGLLQLAEDDVGLPHLRL